VSSSASHIRHNLLHGRGVHDDDAALNLPGVALVLPGLT
jgi:hypothetical protein